VPSFRPELVLLRTFIIRSLYGVQFPGVVPFPASGAFSPQASPLLIQPRFTWAHRSGGPAPSPLNYFRSTAQANTVFFPFSTCVPSYLFVVFLTKGRREHPPQRFFCRSSVCRRSFLSHPPPLKFFCEIDAAPFSSIFLSSLSLSLPSIHPVRA